MTMRMIGQLFRSGTQHGCSWTEGDPADLRRPLGAASARVRRLARHDRRRRRTSRFHDEGRRVCDGFTQRPSNGREELVGVIGLKRMPRRRGPSLWRAGQGWLLAVKKMMGMLAVVSTFCSRSATRSPFPPGIEISNRPGPDGVSAPSSLPRRHRRRGSRDTPPP